MADDLHANPCRRVASFSRRARCACPVSHPCAPDRICTYVVPLRRRVPASARPRERGKEWWVVSVMLRRWSERTSALQAARDLYTATNPENVWAPAAVGRSAPWLLFIRMVDRHGFAPCSPACGAGDLLNDRAAQEKNWSRGWESNPRINGL